MSDPAREISLNEARLYDEKCDYGSVVEAPLSLEDLGRIALNVAKEVISQKVARVERDILYNEFKELEGKIVTGTVRRFEDGDIFVDLGRLEAVLPYEEQIHKEKYSIGDRIRALILKVSKDNTYVIKEKNRVKRVIKIPDAPIVILSRTHPNMLRKLLEIEIPEIEEKEIEIKAVAREPGERAKVAVYSKDKNIDPVGVVVGFKGSRIQNISNELSGEKIDVIEWSEDPAKFIIRAISPAKAKKYRLLPKEKGLKLQFQRRNFLLQLVKMALTQSWHTS